MIASPLPFEDLLPIVVTAASGSVIAYLSRGLAAIRERRAAAALARLETDERRLYQVLELASERQAAAADAAEEVVEQGSAPTPDAHVQAVVERRLAEAIETIAEAMKSQLSTPQAAPVEKDWSKTRWAVLVSAVLVFIPASVSALGTVIDRFWPHRDPVDCIAYVNSLGTLQKDFPQRDLNLDNLQAMYGSDVVEDCGAPSEFFEDSPAEAHLPPSTEA